MPANNQGGRIMIINHNLQAMNTHRQLGIANTGSAKSMEKLSSGYRINRAGDDAAGLAISEKMRGQIRGLNQASRNAQDGISLIQTAEGALDETHAILQRMRELAVQSSTDTNTDADRANIQDEIDQLASEITRISETTEFNTMKLLDGSFEGKKFHIGANEGQNISFDVKDMSSKALELQSETKKYESADVNSSNLDIFTYEGGRVEIEFKAAVTIGGSQVDTVNTDKVKVNKDDTGKLTVTYGEAGITLEDLKAALAEHGAQVAVNDADNAIDLTKLNGETVKVGQFNQADITINSIDIQVTNKEVSAIEVVKGDTNLAKTTAELKDGKLTITLGADATSGTNTDGDYINNILKDAGITGVVFDGAVAEGKSDKIKLVATDEGDAKEVTIGIDVSNQARASKAITTINSALENVSKERSKLGSIQNRLEHTIKNLDTSAENLQASEARIRDVDMAKEMMEQTKQNILQQASTAMLAQANQAPQTVLQLLR